MWVVTYGYIAKGEGTRGLHDRLACMQAIIMSSMPDN